MMRELTSLWHSVGDAEYLHLLLEPLPMFGLGLGLLFLVASVVLGEKKTRLLALVVMAVSCASVQPYVRLRGKSEPRVLALQAPAYPALIRVQTERRSGSAWLYYALAAVCVTNLLMGRGGKALILTVITVVTCSGGFVHAVWLHKKECEVYHRNIVKYAPVR